VAQLFSLGHSWSWVAVSADFAPLAGQQDCWCSFWFFNIAAGAVHAETLSEFAPMLFHVFEKFTHVTHTFILLFAVA
jgi:hypothetical protein